MPYFKEHIPAMSAIRTTYLVFLLSLSMLQGSFSAFAQEASTDATPPEAPKVKILPPAYETQMMRLSEILGALHYLRDLCGANEGQMWREQMQNMLEQEEPTAERRALLIARFNRGFRGFQETYRECTDAAIEANNRYIFEGTRLAGEIPGRYGR